MKIMILYDVKGWAFYHEAVGMQKYLKRNCINVDIESYPKFYKNYSTNKKNQYHLVFLFARQANSLTYPVEKTITTFSSFGDFSKQKELNSDNFARFVCKNQQIYKQAIKDLSHRIDRIVYLPVAIDTEIFKPNNKIIHSKLTFAFVGNHKRKGKGYDIIIDSINDIGNKINFNQALAGSNRLSYLEMVNFYNSIDVLICMSSAEGGPLPSFECGACGVPTICGCQKSAIWEITKNDESCFKIDRTKNALTEKILDLVKHPRLIDVVSKNIRSIIIEQHSWKNVIHKYINMFKEIHNEKI